MAPEIVAPQKEAPEAAPRPRGRLPEAVPPLPLVIGVTGHRDLRRLDVDRLVAGLLEGYVRVMAFSEHAKQFGRMSVVFGKAMEVLRGLPGPDHQKEAQALPRDLRKEALAEHGDWLLLHRDRPLEFHSPH